MFVSMFRNSGSIHLLAWVAALCFGVAGCDSSSSPAGAAREAGTPDPLSQADPDGEIDPPATEIETVTEPEFVTAQATLAVSASSMFDPSDAGSNPAHHGSGLMPRILTEVNQLMSDPLLDRLLRDERVRATDWFLEHDGSSNAAWREVLESTLSAEHVADTTLIRVTATTGTVDDAMTILRAWVDLYLQEVESRAETHYNRDRIAFQRHLENVLGEIELVEARIRRHLLDHPRSATDQRNDAATQELLFLNAKKAEVAELAAAARAAYNALQAANAPAYEPTEEEVELINGSESIQQLDAQRQELEEQRAAEFASGRDETDPVVLNITSHIRHIEVEREHEVDSQVRSLFNAKVELASQTVAIYQTQIETFEPRINELRAQVEDMQRATADYQTLLREQEQLELRYEYARQVLNELDVLIRRAGGVTVELASPAAIVEPAAAPEAQQ